VQTLLFQQAYSSRAHVIARQKFIEAKHMQGKSKSGKADMALSFIQKLYGIEFKLKGKTAEEKYATHQQQASLIKGKLHA